MQESHLPILSSHKMPRISSWFEDSSFEDKVAFVTAAMARSWATQSSGDYFPFMRLPSELRRMIYREVFLWSPVAKDLDPSEFLPPERAIQSKRLTNIIRRERLIETLRPRLLTEVGRLGRATRYEMYDPDYVNAIVQRLSSINLLLVNKQVHDEASEILFKVRFLSIRIDREFLGLNLYRSFTAPSWLSKIRNLNISIDTEWLLLFWQGGKGYRVLQVNLVVCHLAMFASHIVSHCPELENVIVDMACPHQPRNAGKATIAYGCMTAEELERLFGAIRVFRNLRKIELKVSQCKWPAEIKAIFTPLTAVTTRAGCAKGLSEEEKYWLAVWDKAEPLMGRVDGPQEELRMAWASVVHDKPWFQHHMERATKILDEHELVANMSSQ